MLVYLTLRVIHALFEVSLNPRNKTSISVDNEMFILFEKLKQYILESVRGS